jgi:hypothetical protein
MVSWLVVLIGKAIGVDDGIAVPEMGEGKRRKWLATVGMHRHHGP